jgi:mediator of RNA polymerase II transcription subunit 7
LHHPTYLLLILRSLHLNFGELQTILSQNPSLKDQKLEDIKNLFQNAHWLINMYRPHQARESLIAMVEGMVEDGRREMEKCERMKERVEEVLEGLEKRGRETSGNEYEENAESASTPKEPHQDEYARRLWSMMADIKIEED